MTARRAAVWMALALSGCGGAQTPLDLVGHATHYQGRVVVARGPTMARTGDTCDVEVQGASGGTLNCRIRVRCSGDVIYGLSQTGYNHCREHDGEYVFAQDHAGTRYDTDPRLFFDLEVGRIVISDDEPDMEVFVDLLHAPAGYRATP